MDGKVSGTIGGSQPTSSAEPSKTKDKPTEAPTVSIPPPLSRVSFLSFISLGFLDFYAYYIVRPVFDVVVVCSGSATSHCDA